MLFYGENLGVFFKENTVYVFLAEKSSSTKDGALQTKCNTKVVL